MKDVPFFPNTPDGTHCVQACFKIMLKYFIPDQDFSFEQLDRMSQKQPGKGTWWPPMLIELNKLGFLVKCAESFDYKRFYEEGEDYVRSTYPKSVADYYLNRSNLIDIRPLIPDFIDKVKIVHNPATASYIRNFLKDDWLVGLDLNSRTLNNARGYSSHMVVIFDSDEGHFWLHDPGLPAIKNRKISNQKLLEAWHWAGEENAGLVALKPVDK